MPPDLGSGLRLRYSDGLLGAGASFCEGSGKGCAEGVLGDRVTHQQGVIETLDEGRACVTWEGEAPAQRVTAVEHCCKNLFGLHVYLVALIK